MKNHSKKSIILISALLFPSIAYAAEEDFLDTVVGLVDSLKDGDHRLALAAGLVALMSVLKKLRDRVPFFRGKRGGAALLMALSLGGALVAALQGSEPISMELLLTAVSTAFTAAGGYTWVKRMLWPKDKEKNAE